MAKHGADSETFVVNQTGKQLETRAMFSSPLFVLDKTNNFTGMRQDWFDTVVYSAKF